MKDIKNREKLKSRTVPAERNIKGISLHRYVACKESKQSGKTNECAHCFLGFKQI